MICERPGYPSDELPLKSRMLPTIINGMEVGVISTNNSSTEVRKRIEAFENLKNESGEGRPDEDEDEPNRDLTSIDGLVNHSVLAHIYRNNFSPVA